VNATFANHYQFRELKKVDYFPEKPSAVSLSGLLVSREWAATRLTNGGSGGNGNKNGKRSLV